MRYLPDLRASLCGGGGAGDERVLVGITSGDLPFAGHASRCPKFVTIGALAAGLDDASGIVGIRRACVGAIQTIESGGDRKPGRHVPLDARFIIAELLRLHLLRYRRER